MFRPAPNAVVGGKYRLGRPLAQGGMGSIWIAWQAGLERPVAIKLMARELATSSIARARFDREARAAAQLRTPHVVQVHDHGIEDDTPFIVMELLEGEDLNARLRRERRLSLHEAARIAFQIAKALRRAQEAGIVHRDLKPANVFLARADDEEVVKVLDFGIARVTDQGSAAAGGESTRSDALVGSPHYMSPEQARGLEPIDHRSDLWAFGVILFRLTTGALPFPGHELGDIIIRIWNDPHPSPTALAPDLPPALEGFFARALAKDPAARFQSAPEMAAAFAEAAGVAFAAGPDGASPPGSPRYATPVSWAGLGTPAPGLSGGHTPASLTPSTLGATPAQAAAGWKSPEGAGGTLGGNHGLDPRPPSHVPAAVWVLAALGVFGLGAAALVMALRSPETAAATATDPGPAGTESTGPMATASATATATTSTAAPSDTGTGAPASASAAPAAASASSTAAASASSTAKAAGGSRARPKATGQKGHDFGY